MTEHKRCACGHCRCEHFTGRGSCLNCECSDYVNLEQREDLTLVFEPSVHANLRTNCPACAAAYAENYDD